MPVFFTHEKNRVGVRGGVQVAARSNRRCVCMRSQLPVKSWSCDRCLVFIPLQLWRKTAHRPPTGPPPAWIILVQNGSAERREPLPQRAGSARAGRRTTRKIQPFCFFSCCHRMFLILIIRLCFTSCNKSFCWLNKQKDLFRNEKHRNS